MFNLQEVVSKIKKGEVDNSVVESSIKITDDSIYFIINENSNKYLVVSGKKEVLKLFSPIRQCGEETIICGLTHTNRVALSYTFPWINPAPRFGHSFSFGLGDRLGVASLAHLRILKGRKVFPVLAQQSIRELNLTGRTFNDVIDSAAWSVFEAGYTDGYGADGDHLKNPFEIEYAIQSGFPMITLDCSEHINNDCANYDYETAKFEYLKIGLQLRKYYEEKYLGQSFDLGNNVVIKFDEESLYKTVLIFCEAIEFAETMYKRFVIPNNLDFEVSIDETIVPTSPENHYFIAQEFIEKGIIVETMAPKFHGEFQKGIDYVGELDVFESEYKVHQAIADHFNYRLSIHSGSDKFSVFPIIGSISDRGWHVKTAGTNWLEALRVIAKCDPQFMLDIYAFALDNLDKAKAYYVIHATKENAIALSSLNISNVGELLNDDMSRQVLHTTYGLILNETVDHKNVFKDRIYEILKDNYEDYSEYLNGHIEKHLTMLGK